MNGRDTAQKLVSEWARIFGSRLRSALLFGSVARREAIDGVSDVNVLLLVDHIDAATLKQASPGTRNWIKTAREAPLLFEADQWVRAAKAAGATYAVLVAKHCSGFSLWPTEAHPYSVKNAPWKNGKGDIVKDFIASCKKYNIKPGIYASAAANGYCYVDNPGVVQPGSPYTQQQYNAIVTRQLTEL